MLLDAAPRLGFGRIVAAEIAAPNKYVSASGIKRVSGGACNATMRPSPTRASDAGGLASGTGRKARARSAA